MAGLQIYRQISSGIILLAAIFLAGCNKESHARHIEAAGILHNTVPEIFVGDFTWTQVRNGGNNGPYGDSYAEVSAGTTAHINKNGSGTWVFHYEISDVDGGRKSVRIDADVSYEITRLGKNRSRIVVHFLRGKNYMNGEFQHDLEQSDLCPNGDVVYENIEYGRDGAGRTYFSAGPEITFVKK